METRWRRGRQPAAAHHPEGFGVEVEYQGGAAGAQAGGRPNQRMQLSGALRPGLRPARSAGGGERTIEFGSAGIPPAADARFR